MTDPASKDIQDSVIGREDFLDLSAELTGFDRFDLEATGLADVYRAKVESAIDRTTLDGLSQVWISITAGSAPGRTAAIAERIMAAPELMVAAKKIVALWYVGSWYSQLPSESHVLSAQAYVEGLMWKAIGSHPMAAKPQGYGAWSLPPPAQPEGSR